MKSLASLIAILALTTDAQASSSGLSSLWAQYPEQKKSNGIIEIDGSIHSRTAPHVGGLGSHLMNLATTDGSSDSGYIDKNLYDFFNIQIYSPIFVGSNKQ